MRLDKFLAHTGYGTRKSVKELLKSKKITVNELIVKDGKIHIQPETDKIHVAGERVDYQEFYYFMLHKPQGVISATEDNLHKTVIELLKPQDRLSNPFPVGRLDKDTEGLLLLTNDGALAHELLSPRKEVDKCYEAIIEGLIGEKEIEAFEKSITLEDGFRCRPAKLTVLSTDLVAQTANIQVIIHEGKFHQVKRMFEAVDRKVQYLKRLSMGPLELDNSLKIGHYRALTADELAQLKEFTK
ncbi:ribosomal small subunit pseudouridine synthase A [Carnobacterium iners]|uniref:Pseudouridine synthase n=1 Tax=Carnobacterium iners TaxID=1073423 RepID=A0A1X7MQT7_9LACT|nr:pseudouridine synthase [Carnobacterium iners]SEL24868.1 ribosomal small subunit pseudouridine synthase A [Carnobacterium iners]SMH26333.1 ribosomal small subunit pseudouridine synthase A [Carnobacterium iners]